VFDCAALNLRKDKWGRRVFDTAEERLRAIEDASRLVANTTTDMNSYRQIDPSAWRRLQDAMDGVVQKRCIGQQ
jgi:hypothetical protein